MRKTFKLLLALAFLIAAATSCTRNYRDVRITSCSLAGVHLEGLHSLGADIKLGIVNPGEEFSVSDCSGKLKAGGKEVMDFVAEDMKVPAGCDTTCIVSVSGSLSGGTSALWLLENLQSIVNKGLKINVRMKLTDSDGLGTTLSYRKAVPIGS